MASRKPCINNPAFTYNGTEQSPLRFGLTAEAYPINAVLEGFDKRLWAVEVKNNRKVWVRKEESFKMTSVSREEPVINDEAATEESSLRHSYNSHHSQQTQEISEQPIQPLLQQQALQMAVPKTIQKEQKKTTDYNIFLSYRLKQLKQLPNTQQNEPSEGKECKTNFAKALEEWKIIKNKPEELKKILEEAHKSEESAESITSMQPTQSTLQSSKSTKSKRQTKK